MPSSSNTGSFTVSWNPSTPQVTGYTLSEKVGSGNWTAVYSGTATSVTLSNRGNGTYNYELQAFNNTTDNTNIASGVATAGPLVVTLPPSPAPQLSVPNHR